MRTNVLSTEVVAKETGLTPGRICQIAQSSNLGFKVGRAWLFTPEDVKKIAKRQDRRRKTSV